MDRSDALDLSAVFPSMANGQRLHRLLERIEACHRSSAHRLRQGGHDSEARRVERFAANVRFDRDDPTRARQLYGLANGLRRETDVRSFTARALEGALVLAGAERGNLQLRNPATRSLRIAAHSGFDKEFLEYFAVVEDDQSACGRAAVQRRQVVIADVNADPGFAPHRDIAAHSGFRAVLSTPLVGADARVVGVLSTHYDRPHHPSQEDLLTIQRYGELVGGLLAQTEGREAAARSGRAPLGLPVKMA